MEKNKQEKNLDDLEIIIRKLNNQEKFVLRFLIDYKQQSIMFDQLFEKLYQSKQDKYAELMRTLELLENKSLIKLSTRYENVVVPSPKLKEYISNSLDLPERRLLKLIAKKNNIGLDVLNKLINKDMSRQEFNVGLGILKKNLLIKIKQNIVSLTERGKDFLNKKFYEESLIEKIKKYGAEPIKLEDLAKQLNETEKLALSNLIKRGLIKKDKKKVVIVEISNKVNKIKTNKYMALLNQEVIDTISTDVIKKGIYKNKRFRYYDIDVKVPKAEYGSMHFITQAINEIKKVWLSMGFKEMKSRIIESAFWDLDVLFVPQNHPARTMQDTFYLDLKIEKLPKIAKIVKDMHEHGNNTQSTGWQYKWKEDEAKKMLLRTHTTVTSARTLFKLRQEIVKNNKLVKDKLPVRLFTIGRVYRNEALDKKHLFEFNQVEGIVVDDNANLGHLKFYLKEFFTKMGFDKIKIRPSYFPYTEPSLEVFAYEKNEWIELAGAGILRPEVTKVVLGVEVPVLAWGIGLERVIARFYGLDDIRLLYKNNLNMLRYKKVFRLKF